MFFRKNNKIDPPDQRALSNDARKHSHIAVFFNGVPIIAFPERFWRCCKNKVLQPVNRVFSPKLRLVAFLFGCKIKIWKVAKLTNFLSQLKINSDSITHLASSVPPKLLNKKRHKSTRFVEFQSSN